jgi:uncharacterized protein (TIGR00369 family)
MPAFAGYEARVRDSFARQGAMALIGAALADVAPGYCAIALEPRPEVSQQHGYVHAGILATLVDSAGGYAAFTLFAEDCSILTVEYKLNVLAPAQGERIVAEGFVVKPGLTCRIAPEKCGNRRWARPTIQHRWRDGDAGQGRSMTNRCDAVANETGDLMAVRRNRRP